MAITSRILGQRGQRQAKERGIDPARVPPGQYLTERFPVLTVGPNPKFDLSAWDFGVFGEVETPVTLTWDELMALPQREVKTDIHCVTRWSKLDMPWKGVPMRALLDRVQPLESARFVIAHAEQGFTANLPIEAIQDDGVLLAYEAEGAPLTPEHGYPLRLLVPSRYFWKSAKWLRGFEFIPDDRPGFWESYGYHMRGDPWQEERYDGD